MHRRTPLPPASLSTLVPLLLLMLLSELQIASAPYYRKRPISRPDDQGRQYLSQVRRHIKEYMAATGSLALQARASGLQSSLSQSYERAHFAAFLWEVEFVETRMITQGASHGVWVKNRDICNKPEDEDIPDSCFDLGSALTFTHDTLEERLTGAIIYCSAEEERLSVEASMEMGQLLPVVATDCQNLVAAGAHQLDLYKIAECIAKDLPEKQRQNGVVPFRGGPRSVLAIAGSYGQASPFGRLIESTNSLLLRQPDGSAFTLDAKLRIIVLPYQ